MLLATYVLPLFLPPAARILVAPGPDATLLERLFPTVPGWWIALRLLCLAAGAALIASTSRSAAPVRLLRTARRTPPPEPGRVAIATALFVAGVLAALSATVGTANRAQQVAYFVALWVPAAMLWLSTRRGAAPPAAHTCPRKRQIALLAVAVLAAWSAWRIPAALHSPRAASPTDTWLTFQWMLEALADGRNLLVSSSQPGVSDSYMIFLGFPLLDATGSTPSLAWLQGFHVVWILLTAALCARLAGLVSGRAAAPIVASALLFSPLMLMTHLTPAPFGLPTMLAVAMLLLTRAIYLDPSTTRIAALGVVAGVSATYPYLMHLAGATLIAVIVRALRRPRLPPAGLVIAAATCFAAAFPSLPDVAGARRMVGEYVQMNWQWAGGEAILLGQRSPRRDPDMRALTRMGHAAPYDVALGGLLMPFAVPRTGLRLAGDTLFEPIAAALAAVGLAACLRRPTRRGAAALLAVGALAVLPAVATRATDRVSMTRAIGTPVALALFAGVGFQVTRRALFARRRTVAVATATTAASMVAGALIFDVITPRLIPASWLEIGLQAVRNVDDPRRVIVLDQVEPYGFGWLHVREVATHLPAHPIPTWTFATAAEALPPSESARPELILWSPAVEEDAHVSQAICARWPDADLYVLEDRAGLGRAFAATPDGAAWRPALGDSQWTRGDCAQLAGAMRGRY